MGIRRFIWDGPGRVIEVNPDHHPTGLGSGHGLQIIPDIDPYDSPVDGAYVGSRRDRREDLKRTNCRPFEKGEKEHFIKNHEKDSQRATNAMLDKIFR